MLNFRGRYLCSALFGSGMNIRLVNGSRPSQGRLEVFYNNTWGTVCKDKFNSSAAIVVCRMLGFNGNMITAATKDVISYGQGPGTIWLDDVTCNGTESSLSHCRANNWDVNNCGHEKDVGVECTLNIRLKNGSRPSQGRLEVFYNNTWGTVCDNNFDILAARVVCRMLGYTGSTFAVHGQAAYGQGTGKIWLNIVTCTGSDSRLFNCRANWGVHNCRHSEDVGVDCDFNPSISIIGNQMVKENSSLSLSCQLSTCSTSACTYIWTSTQAIPGSRTQQNIKLTNIKRDWNAAIMYCQITFNASVSIISSTTMNVQYGPSSATISVSSPLTVTENTLPPTAITCSSPVCNPGCNAKWSAGSTPIYSTTLFSTPVERHFAGSYNCTVFNAVGFWTKQLEVIVNYAPNVTLHWDESSKNFTCTAAGNPDNYTFHPLEFRILGSPIKNISFPPGTGSSRYLVLKELSYQDTGSYTCTVENGILKNGATKQSHTKEVEIKGTPLENIELY
ncbi:neurotrypsin-like isoform X2 [Dreissena polymorpha]|uniref:neurotrypsin-like isoform X2 n=1 Tax=Dreissena polymorpha TaxID=45954 RepID=UPI0022643084|nr:neurotrypsin-like isoform X2 [Dreissena polymorpha]